MKPQFTQTPVQTIQNSPIILPPQETVPFWRKYLKWLVGALIIALLILSVLAFLNRETFKESNVEIELSGPEEMISGQEAELKLKIHNSNKVALEQTKITVFYPEGAFVQDENGKLQPSLTQDIPMLELGAKETREFILRPLYVGDKGAIRTTKVELRYSPSNIESSFIKQTERSTLIQSTPVQLTVVVPPNVFPNQRLTFLVDYRNITSDTINDFQIKLSYPDGFTPDRFSPSPTEGKTTWGIKNLGSNQGDRISVEGVIYGNEREVKTFKAIVAQRFLDQYVEIYSTTVQSVIASKLLDVGVLANNQGSTFLAQAGQTINYTINFSNHSQATLSGLTLQAKLEGIAYDLKSIRTDGFFDEASRTITWSGAVVPELLSLNPNRNGTAQFSVTLKRDIPLGQTAIRVSANIETFSVPPGFGIDKITGKGELTSRIGSQFDFQTIAYYNDPIFPVNSGPTPPQVNEKTTYTIHWRVFAAFNDLNQITVTSFLPPGVSWENKAQAQAGQELIYNPVTGMITWKAPAVPAGSGSTLSVFEAIFQVGITPSINQQGSSVTLIQNSSLQGTDALTNKPVSLGTSGISTSNITGGGGGLVQP